MERAPLFGRGLGTTTTTKPIPGNRYSGKPPHNELVRYLVETGLVGLVILLGALAALMRALFLERRALVASGGAKPDAPTLAIMIMVGCLVNSLADNTFLNSPTCYAAGLVVVTVLSIPATGTRRVPVVHRT